MTERSNISPELEKKFDAEPVTLDQIDAIIADIERWLVNDPHLTSQVKLARMKIERVFLDNVWNTEVIKLAELKTRELQLALESLNHDGEASKDDSTKKSGEPNYKKIPDNVVAFTGQPRERVPKSINENLKKAA